jgi:DNA-binding XRE family transcriptional regulator
MAIEQVAGESATKAKRPTVQRIVTEREFEERRLLLTLPINGDGKLLKEIRTTALRLSRENFAKFAGVNAESIRLIEKGKPFVACQTRMLVAIASALEKLGIRFTHDDSTVWEIAPGSAIATPAKPGCRYAGEMSW